MSLDEKDAEILRIYEGNPRLGSDQLATLVGLSLEDVEERLAHYRRNGITLPQRGLVNWERTGVPHVTAIIEVHVTPQRQVGFDAIAQRIARFPEVKTLYLVSGTYDLSVVAVGRSIQEVSNFISRKVATIEGVTGTVTHFLLRAFKMDGVLLDEEQELPRQAIVP